MIISCQSLVLDQGDTYHTSLTIPPQTSVLQVNVEVLSGAASFYFSPVAPAPSYELHCGKLYLEGPSSDSILVSAVHSPYPLSDVLYMTVVGDLDFSSANWSYTATGNGAGMCA